MMGWVRIVGIATIASVSAYMLGAHQGRAQGRTQAVEELHEHLSWSKGFCRIMTAEPAEEDAYCDGYANAAEYVENRRDDNARFGDLIWK